MALESESDEQQAVAEAVLRGGVLCSSLFLLVSYLLPWVEITGQVAAVGEVAGESSISAAEIELIPELLAGIAVFVAVLALLRWTMITQSLIGVSGLIGSFFALYGWAGLGVDDGPIEVANYAGPPESFDPAIGLWLAIAGSLLLVSCGFGAVVYEYVDQEDTE